MTKIFSFVEFVANFDSIIINFSLRYHICSKYFIQFSLISRLLIHAQKNCNKIYTCKHCEKIFTSNNKLHMHVRLYYIKFDKTLKQRFVEKKNNHINLSISRFISSITFKSMIISIKSLFLIIFITKTFVVCLFTSSSNSFRISILSHITSKIYMIMKKLFEMIVEKTDKKNRKIIQKKSTFSCFFEFRQFRQTRIKSIDSQENLKDSIMLAKKKFRKNLNALRKKIRFSFFRYLIKSKSLIISNLLINRSNHSNSVFSSIVFVRHFEFTFQSIEQQKFRNINKLRSMKH